MNLEQKLKLWYPKDVLVPSTPYVYFDSLLQTETGRYIYSQIAPYFSSNLSPTSFSSSQSKILSALNFLEKVIQSESAKEASFIEFLRTKTRKCVDEITIPGTDEDWTAFIQEIQKVANINPELGLKSLANEFNRLAQNQEVAADSSSNYTKVVMDQVEAVSKFLKRIESTIDKNNKYSTDFSKQIYNMVLSEYGADLLEIDGEYVKLNRGQVFSLIEAISAMALKNYAIETYDEGFKEFNPNQFYKIITDQDFSKNIKSYIQKAKDYPFITEDLMDTLEIMDNNYSQSHLSKKEGNKILETLQSNNLVGNQLNQLNNLLEKNFINPDEPLLSSKAFKLVSKGNVLAEILSAITWGMNTGAIYGRNTGSKGAKPDNILAFLTIDLSELSQHKNSKEIAEKIMQIRQVLKEITNSLSAKNTTEYYQNQQKVWSDGSEKIKTLLNEISELYGDIVDCYTIEDSTKNYTTLYSRYQGNINKDFHGGSLGANLNDQLNKIAALGASGGFDLIDIQWLVAAIINSGPGMIAKGQKNSIEQYLASFAALLLFDDQVNIADEAIYNMGQTSGSSVKKIHLFSLNNGYYPLSYILHLTYDALFKGYNTILSEIQSGSSVKVDIIGYVSEQQYYSYRYNNWENLSASAQKSTKLQVHFMVHFMNILNTLLPNFN